MIFVPEAGCERGHILDSIPNGPVICRIETTACSVSAQGLATAFRLAMGFTAFQFGRLYFQPLGSGLS